MNHNTSVQGVSNVVYIMYIHFQPMELREVSEKLKSMEQLSLNNGNGQSYGYIVYRKKYRIYIRIVIS